MGNRILLLRGINIGSNRRVAMPKLRETLTAAGMKNVDVRPKRQLVVSSRKSPDKLARETERAIADEFGFDVDVVVRTRDELAAVVKRNPLGDVVDNPSAIR